MGKAKVKRQKAKGFEVSLLSGFCLLLFLLLPLTVQAQARRVVIIKVDGLPNDLVDRFVHERDERTGKSQLPWIERVFYQQGTRIENFYVRGMSLSGPSWSLLDTGQHLQIKGNVEFDRYTLHAYDYLNFIQFYVNNVASRRIDMPGAEVLDELGLPLLVDAYANEERYNTFQLYQRGLRWPTLAAALPEHFKGRSVGDLLDEWTTGLEMRRLPMDQVEREIVSKLQNPRLRYLDYYTTEFDHVAHHNRDRASHLTALRELDETVGRIWNGIEKSPFASETALILVSDHGFNTDERVYSQGFNLVKLLGSAAGGGHHVITKRRLLLEYSLKGIYPLVPLITTTTNESYYLKGQSTEYPTALLDFDGNERASIHLRDSDLNLLHILLQQLQRKDLAPNLRSALARAFFLTVDKRRAEWQTNLAQLNEEIAAQQRTADKQRAYVLEQKQALKQSGSSVGRESQLSRMAMQVDSWTADVRDYNAYAQTLTNLLALRPENFDPHRLKIEDVIARGAMGERNTVYQLQNYVVAMSPSGFTLAPDGSLDMQKSFRRIDYFALLGDAAVRNNVQEGVDNHPVDFVAVPIPLEQIAPSLDANLRAGSSNAIWLYGGANNQALILSRETEAGSVSLRYLPIANLKQEANGDFHFERTELRAGLPLKILEDKQLNVPAGSREEFLGEWHTDLEWLRALHKTEYSNALIGLQEQLIQHRSDALDTDAQGLSTDERLIRRFRKRQRALIETDLLVLAHNHWNFDVRGFNPGGNHGSFLRISTHSTLMFAGGAKTGIPQGASVEEPYDGLSFVPTVLALTGQLQDGQKPVPVLWERGFRTFPGRIITEVVREQRSAPQPSPIAQGAKDAPK